MSICHRAPTGERQKLARPGQVGTQDPLPSRLAANATYHASDPGLAMASWLTTFSIGWPSSSFLIGSSCFLPERVRGISGTWKMSSGMKRGLKD